ncbi:putative ABC transport system ATP-binding protein [Sphingopyxis panaciterrae]|uniref:ABC transporter ATP-binding protein n=1 Tax=Sphingopyxis panaciterrae TaxID=363841 RepID=UPI0014205865|nr:ABC transporter ATP-binding protein [Sphingopyxis panaciterrae]NIJ35450.1 putative ABC transport system ATP-binding protein [Sphingopyxis panaciterrae]
MLRVENISKSYATSDVRTHALSDVSLAIGEGEFVAIMGPSGCGKSTLLNILGLLDRADGGRIELLGEDVSGASERDLTRLRRAAIGFVFQSFNLVDELTVTQNVELGLLYRGAGASERRERVEAALDRVGMRHRARHLPKQLSGGQQQRVAIARAIVSDPQLILADEPTGNLDTVNGEAVMDLLQQAVARGTSVVMVTHSLAQADRADRKIQLLDGRVVSQTRLGA